MALKAAGAIRVCPVRPHSQLGPSDLGFKRFGFFGLDLRWSLESKRVSSKWECCSSNVLASRAITSVEVEKPLSLSLEPSREIERVQDAADLKVFHKDLSLLPKPLTASYLSSLDDGTKVQVAYQGIAGAYSEAAALKAYPNCETVPCEQFEAAFKAVELWLVDKAVLPIENSVAGSIHRNYDLLLRHRLHIVGEVQLAVDHCLLGVPGVQKEELKRVISHPQALAQCEMTLSKFGFSRVTADDTAGAAQLVAKSGVRDTGAVASARAAEIYGLDILAEKIQDDDDNVTRFLLLAREPIIPGVDGRYKTSIVFTLEEGPGVLFKALAVFALREINLSKRAAHKKKRPLRVVDDSNKGSARYFDYLFYVDFEASMAEPRAQNALGHLQALAQCEMTLSKFGFSRVTADDTAGAAQLVAKSGVRDTGAVASARAAEIYGLDILAEKIQDDDDNVTRFLLLAREPIIPGVDGRYKTSIVFTLEEGPGVLFKALAVFALREINLSKIESRPQKKRPLRVVDDSNKGSARYFDYLFYVDFEASMAEPRAQNALGHLQEFARFLRVLGCYPVDPVL